MERFLKRCIDCDREFFTEGERSFYRSKDLVEPRRCKECREKRRLGNQSELYDAQPILDEIASTWKLEAKQEQSNLFYYVDEVNELLNGNKSYVIGRKGMGKTAIGEYIYQNKEATVFSERLSFKNFPFNMLYGLDNKQYTQPNQYITIWKYLIYSSICKMMIKNEAIDKQLRQKLEKIYTKEPIKALNKMVERWTADEFGMEVFGVGGSIGGIKKVQQDLAWIEKTSILEDVIEGYIDQSNYYIIIDELDEDYRDFEEAQQRKTYINLLTSLFKAVQDIRSYFKDSHDNIRPIVFLKSDIYALIKDSDKNKWSDFKLDLAWTPDKLKNMISYRIAQTDEEKAISQEEAWKKIFKDELVVMGNGGHNRMTIFDYMTRSTHWRPRDYIHYISECCKLAISKKEKQISASTVKEVDKEFSEYLKGEIVDEIFAVVPNIDEIFSILSEIRKQTFPTSEFHKIYNERIHTGETSEKILLQLFEHGVIGNQPSMKGQQIFKHQYPNALFNYKENVVIHRGLYKALQIF